MLKKAVSRAECRVEFDWYLEGSVLAGTVKGGASACRTRLIVDSPEPEEDVLKVIRLAKQGCFAEQMVHTAVPLTSTYVVNGQAVGVALEGEASALGP